MMKNLLLILLSNVLFVNTLTCNEILEAPEERKWSLRELRSLASKEIISCLAHLGKAKMSLTAADHIWQTLVKFYGGIENIPENDLMHLRWITIAINAADLYNMTFSNIDVIENFGYDYHLNDQQLEAIADRVREDWGGKLPEDYSYYDLIALRQILCAFNRSEIERIHPEAYKEAASVIGTLHNCRSEVLQGFATLAVQSTAFGPASEWDHSQIQTIGIVANYVPGKKFHDSKHEHQ